MIREVPRVFVPLLEPARYKGAYGGRGSGKSHEFAELLIGTCLARPGFLAVCVREVQKSLTQSVKRLLENKIVDFGVGHKFRVLKTEIETPGGGLIAFQGMQNHTAETIKSLEGFDLAWVEEAQTLSQTSLDLLRPTIRKARSELWFSWNPSKPTDPVDSLLRCNAPLKAGESRPTPPPGAIIVNANWSDNPWFDDTVLIAEKDYDLRRDPDKYAHIWMGEYVRNSEARVFRNWRVEEFETPESGVQFYFGADWGTRIDPTVLIRCYIEGRTLFVDYEAYEIGCTLDRKARLFDNVPGSRKHIITADGSWPDVIDFMQDHGFPRMRAAVKGAGSVVEGIEWLQSYDIVVHPRCQHVIDELTCFSFKIDPKTGEVTSVLSDKKNHTIDSIRYALEAVRRANVVTVEEFRL